MRRLSCAMRSRASRRSVSIWDSPGPRVPMPPPSRSRWVHRPRMRARLYSSCASSTWSLPSAEAAWSAKMSRMIAVRSITGTPVSCSRLRSWRGSSSSSQAIRFAFDSCDRALQLLDLALAEVVVRVGLAPALDQLARDRDAGGAQQLLQLGKLVAARRRAGDGSTAMQSARWRARGLTIPAPVGGPVARRPRAVVAFGALHYPRF